MTVIDDLNYFNDPRNRPAREPVLYHDDGTEERLPTRWEVCHVCGGEGKHVNPSIDAGGISADEFHDDPDFHESYMRGDYDVTCNRCNGRTTVAVVDIDKLTPEQKHAYARQLQDEADDRAERMAEIRMGA